MKPVEYFFSVEMEDFPGTAANLFVQRDNSIPKELYDCDSEEDKRELQSRVMNSVIEYLKDNSKSYAENIKYRVCEYHDHGALGDMIIRKGWIELPGKVEVGNVKGS